MAASDTPIGDAVAQDFSDFPVGLTARGRAIYAGQNSLTLDQSMNRDTAPAEPADAAQDGEPVAEPAPSTPVEGAGSPPKETADDQSAVDRETREN